MVAAAIVGSAVVGGVVQSNAASKAASAQKKAAAQANATQQGFFDTTQANLKPYIETGNQAAAKVSQLEGLNGAHGGAQAALESLPGYQFANYQGLKSTQNSATQRGLGVSGAAQKAAANYSTGLANSYYNNLLSGIQNTETVGANAAGGLATAATNTGASMAQNTIGAGNAQAGSNISRGSAVANAAQGLPAGLLTGQLLQNQANLSSDQTSFLGSSAYTPSDAYLGFGDNAARYVPPSTGWSPF